MHKKELIERLGTFVETYKKTGTGWKGQKSFAEFLIHYLKNLQIPHDDKYDFWEIEHHLPQLMVDAFEQLQIGTDDITTHFRKDYEEEAGHEVPNITDLGASNVLHQGSAIQTTLGFMLSEVMGKKWLGHEIDTYCNAQKYVLQQTFDKFLRRVYRQGLYEMADKCKQRGMSGVFGETELRTFIMAGSIMFTFAKRIDKSKNSYYKKGSETYCNERAVSFVAEDSDPLGLSAGLQSVQGDFRTTLDMIEEVIAHWPKEQSKKKKLFKANTGVSIG